MMMMTMIEKLPNQLYTVS